MRSTKNTMRSVRARKICDFLVRLKQLKMSTPEVESNIKRTCRLLNEREKQYVKMKIMRKKIADSFECLRSERKNTSRLWKMDKKVIPITIRADYLHRWRSYTELYKRQLSEHFDKRVTWILKKWRSKTQTSPNVVRDIIVNNVELTEEFASDPRKYGEVTLTEEHEMVLRLPPKFGLFRKINPIQCKIDTEEALNKLRWTKKFMKEGGGERRGGREVPGMVDDTDMTVDINRLKVTDLPFNPSVTMPSGLEVDEEVKMHMFKVEVDQVVRHMEKESKEWSNLSEVERKALGEMVEKVREGEAVYTVTDKSGRWASDSVESYKKACEKHLVDENKTPKITMEDHLEAEEELNCHTLALIRMLGLSPDVGGDRVRNALTTQGVKAAPFYGLRKDHKIVEPGREEEGPPVRPLCGAKDCTTKRLAYILCMILSELIPDSKTNCVSTEELIAELERTNTRGQVKDTWVVGSLDIDSLYPSLDIERCADVVARKLESSDLKFEKLRWKEVVLYLKFNMEYTDEGYKEVFRNFPRRRRYVGRPPRFTASGSQNKRTVRHGPWIFPTRRPNDRILRRMFCMAIKIMICRTMSLHDYRFNGQLYRQKEGGSIGLDLTGVISDIYI